jgi:acetyltransferase-like isoleucine patch superfamily enzyme
MFSSNGKLIEAVLKRLIKKKKNNYDDIINNQKSTNNIKVRRLSTLLSRRSADKKRFSITKNKNFIEGNKMNLKIVPLTFIFFKKILIE